MADVVRVTSNGQARNAMLVSGPADANGNAQGSAANPTVTQSQQNTYPLASNVASLAAGAATAPVTVTRSGGYVWTANYSGTGPYSLKLQSLGADGVTWQDIDTTTAASSNRGVSIAAGANGSSVRLFNAGANAITNLYSNLSS